MTASQPVLDVSVGTARARPDYPRHDARAWSGEDVSPSDGAVDVRDAVEKDITVIGDKRLSAPRMMGRGQMRIFDNCEGLHHRSEFRDGSEVQRERHVVQPWFREEDRPFFGG